MNYCKIVLLFLATLFTSCTSIAKQESHDMNFALIKGIPVIDVRINGTTTKLAIDTGADNDEICIPIELITKMHLVETQGTSQSLDVKGIKHESQKYLANNVIIGEYKFSDVSISEEQREMPFDGVIGNKLLEKIGVISIDYQTNTINFNKPENIRKVLSGDKWNRISYSKSKEGIAVPLFYNNIKYSFIFDTGNAVFMNNNEVYGIINKKAFDQINTVKKPQSITMIGVKLDNTYFESMSFYAVELPEMFQQDGLLGYHILQNKKLVIDYKNHFLYLSVN